MPQTFRELVVWQKAMSLVLQIYKASRAFPKEEYYGPRSQLRRAAVSIPSNIAEGQGRMSRGEFVQFLGHAKGSLAEVETQVEIAKELQFISPEDHKLIIDLASEVGRTLNGLINSMRRSRDPVSRNVSIMCSSTPGSTTTPT